MTRRAIALAGPLILVCLTAGRPTAAEVDAKGAAFFERHIRPLLVEHCYRCHSSTAKNVRGGLRLDSRVAWQRGGDSGPAVIPGSPKESLLIRAVRYEDPALEMPPKEKLSDREIALFIQWVQMGSPDPRSETETPTSRPIDLEAAGRFWSFRPALDPAVPEVEDRSWPLNDVDRFILTRLEAARLRPAPRASKRDLIRRATFDLIGLPPAPQDVRAFLEDDSPDAFPKVVDRLLASPRYGERWGRHWLDVARYADSNGLDENVAFGNAWRYRDYVVSGFNHDKPYDEFVREQIAGDLLPATDAQTRHEQLIATGFLSLGPKVLAEPDPKKMEMDIIDEQIDTVGRAFMGLTLGCARCHHHKYDPIRTEDYYAMAGIFKSTKTMEGFQKVARWHENSLANDAQLATKKAHDEKIAAQKDIVARLEKENSTGATVEREKEKLKQLQAAVPKLPSAMGVTHGRIGDVPVHIRGSHLRLGEVVPRGVPAVFQLHLGDVAIATEKGGRLPLARWLVDKRHPLTVRVIVNRVWRWHFGRGLVSTTDNFGRRGAEPSHPTLLDWLARRFIEDGWSLKSLHRRILLSQTYRMSSQRDGNASQVDPENRLLWRMNVRRLEAETIRDSLLTVAGELDLAVGGNLLHVKNRGYLFDHTSKDTTSYGVRRRSVYLPVIRNNLFEVFQLFDYPDPAVITGNRETTTVASQALFLLNSELVDKLASAMAQRAQTYRGDAQAVLRRLYQAAYARDPSVEETTQALTFIDDFAASWQPVTDATNQSSAQADVSADPFAARQHAWQALCQVLISANEFIYLK